MAAALRPQTVLALDYGNAPLPPRHGSRLKRRVPAKFSFKNPKYIVALFVTNDYPGGSWEDQGYDWFSDS
jgi:DMSO/TMAO reductase YedYZ molybdopterin-dependent catalytic subunit